MTETGKDLGVLNKVQKLEVENNKLRKELEKKKEELVCLRKQDPRSRRIFEENESLQKTVQTLANDYDVLNEILKQEKVLSTKLRDDCKSMSEKYQKMKKKIQNLKANLESKKNQDLQNRKTECQHCNADSMEDEKLKDRFEFEEVKKDQKVVEEIKKAEKNRKDEEMELVEIKRSEKRRKDEEIAKANLEEAKKAEKKRKEEIKMAEADEIRKTEALKRELRKAEKLRKAAEQKRSQDLKAAQLLKKAAEIKKAKEAKKAVEDAEEIRNLSEFKKSEERNKLIEMKKSDEKCNHPDESIRLNSNQVDISQIYEELMKIVSHGQAVIAKSEETATKPKPPISSEVLPKSPEKLGNCDCVAASMFLNHNENCPFLENEVQSKSKGTQCLSADRNNPFVLFDSLEKIIKSFGLGGMLLVIFLLMMNFLFVF